MNVPSEKGNFTYLLLCSDGSYYCGWTNDLLHRVQAHNSGRGAKYTRTRRPVKLVYYESFATKEEAMSREWHIKHMTRAEKEALLQNRKGEQDMEERLQQQMNFCLEIDKEKNILRQTHLSGDGRRENDAEHAWHMAIMAYVLREYSNEPVDIGKVMLMCLIHDIVEIDAGDTYAYDAEGLKTQKEREEAAKERIYSLLPDDQKRELQALFEEFEAYETPEAKFARAMDNLQPLMLNNSNHGGDWKGHQVTAEQVYGRQAKTKLGSETLYALTDEILKEHIRAGNLLEL